MVYRAISRCFSFILLLVIHRGFTWPSKWLSCYICGAVDVDCLGIADSVGLHILSYLHHSMHKSLYIVLI